MKAQIIETKGFHGEYENRVNAIVRYGNKTYAVSVTCYHDFNENFENVIDYITSLRYLTTVKENSTRDLEIRRALRGTIYSC